MIVKLRSANTGDESWILGLQRQPSVREFSRNPLVPTEEEHHDWFLTVLKDDWRELYIIESDGKPVGTLRLDLTMGSYDVSISIEEGCRRNGIASMALKEIREMKPNSGFRAFILPMNEASIRLFIGQGYEPIGNNWYRQSDG